MDIRELVPFFSHLVPGPSRKLQFSFCKTSLFPNWTVLGKNDRRSLEVAAAVPWFWRKDCQSLPTFVSFVYVSMGGMSGKHSAKKPAETRTTPTTVRSASSERFYQTSAESLEVAFTLRLFFRKKSKKSNFMLLCTK